MSRRPDLQKDHQTLTNVHRTMLVVAGLLGFSFLSLLGGTPIENACLPIGIAGIVTTLVAMWYAATRLTDRSTDGPLSQWSNPIRTMAGINIAVSGALMLYPHL